MYDRQVEEKLQAEKAYKADAQTQQCVAGLATDQERRPTLREQIEKRHFHMADRDVRLLRAHEILTRHPEFELFLELQDLCGPKICTLFTASARSEAVATRIDTDQPWWEGLT